MDGATKLTTLGDRIPVPIPGHREVDSLGDLALAAGAGQFAFAAAYRRRWDVRPGIMTRWAPGHS
jgi:hypothetical protein